MKGRSIRIASAMLVSLVVISGCATKGDIDSLRAEIDALRVSTEKALANSVEASANASASLQELDIVKRDAAAAQARAEETAERVDDVFERSMLK